MPGKSKGDGPSNIRKGSAKQVFAVMYHDDEVRPGYVEGISFVFMCPDETEGRVRSMALAPDHAHTLMLGGIGQAVATGVIGIGLREALKIIIAAYERAKAKEGG